jgi:hypothetical protein
LSLLVAKGKELAELAGAWWSRLQYVVVGFVAGAVLCLAAIFVPVYSQVETLSQPVTLFETILGDLESAYVDEVDVEKLLETSVSAMLRSLDPYTEFESKQAARDLTESIDGKYAGVGLVIAGEPGPIGRGKPIAKRAADAGAGSSSTQEAPPPAPADAKIESPLSAPPSLDGIGEASRPRSGPGASASAATSLAPTAGLVASQDSRGTSADTSIAAEDDGDEDEDDDEALLESSSSSDGQPGAARRGRRRPAGIRVVSAFEGYAFDYGLRVGDQLVAVDHVPVEEMGSIDQVRNYLRGEPGAFSNQSIVVFATAFARFRAIMLAITDDASTDFSVHRNLGHH